MPHSWVKDLIDTITNPCEVIEFIIETANVSADAALVRVKHVLNPGYVYAEVDNEGLIISSGRSAGTLANVPGKGHYLEKDAVFPASVARWESRTRDRVWLWWHFPNEVILPMSSDGRDWREILEDILYDLHLDPNTSIKIKQTINGIVGYINGSVRRDLNLSTPEALYAASMQRFNSRALDNPVIRECLTHRDFPIYLVKRVRAFVEK
jgi:hypothetical protein